MIHKITHATKHLSIWTLIASAIILTVIRLLLMGVEGYKSDLESQLFELTNIPIKIGTLRANTRGINPEIILRNVQVKSDDGQEIPAIQLEEVRLGIDLIDLILTRQLLPSSWLTLVGAELSIVRKQDGSITIAGLNESDSEQPLWLLKTGQYEVLKSKIIWLDQQRKATAVTFNQVDLVIKNDFDQQSHEIHLISELPPQYGDSLRVSMSIQGNVFEIDDVKGMVYVEGRNIHLAELLTGELPSEIELIAGKGDFQQWSLFEKSKLTAMVGDVNAQNVTLKKQQKTFEINSLSTHFNAHNNSDSGWQLGVEKFAIKTNQKTWPVAEFNVFANKKLTQIAASIVKLDLEALTETARFFIPLDDKQLNNLLNLELKGELNKLLAYIDVENDKYAINGQFKNIAAAIPGADMQLTNLSGRITGTQEQGAVDFNTQKGHVFFSGLFRDAFAINKLKGTVTWQQSDTDWQIKARRLELNTNHAKSQSQLTVKIPKNEAPVFMDLQSTFADLDVNTAFNYYPVTIMDKELVEWLDNAFVSGKVNKGDLLVSGELKQFPFLENEGVFEVAFDLVDGELNYAPGWPHLQQMAADIVFFQNGVTIDTSHATSHGLTVKHALIDIPSFDERGNVLVDGIIEGKIADSLVFMQNTPLHQPIDKVVKAITPVGLTHIDLGLKIPLTDPDATQVNVVAHLNNSQLKINAIDMDVVNLTGDLKITENGVFGSDITATAMSYPIDVDVNSDEGKTQVNIKGQTDVKQLQKQFSFLNNAFVKQGRIKGKTNYQVGLDLPVLENKAAELRIDTDLLGVAVDLPETLHKPANQKKPLAINMQLYEQALLPIKLNYDNQLKVAINFDKEKDEMFSTQLVYGENQASLSDKKGINIIIEQDAFNASDWAGLISATVGDAADSASGLTGISLTTKQLQWKGKEYGALEIAIQQLQQQWKGSLSCSIAKGAFVLPVAKAGKEKIKLEMAYLNLSELLKFNKQMEGVESDDIPLIQVFSDALWWNAVDLGRLEIETEKIADGVRFKSINVVSDKHRLALKADWIKTENGSVTELYGDFAVEEVGDFLSKMEFTDDIKEAQANIGFFSAWAGTPYQFSLQSINAEIDLELKDGRIASIEPGFGRLLGLIAMEQWVKRVMLDFGDVYKQGLSFNNIMGHFNLSEGQLRTKDLMVDAVPAQISLVGKADLVTETLDYQVLVVPKSSGALPIAGTIVSGIAGVITQALTDDYKDGYFFGSKYNIAGPWDNVKVTALHKQDGILKKTWSGLTDFSWMQPVVE